MGKLEQRFFVAYLAWAILEMVAQIFKESYPVVHGVVKSGLMPILILMVVVTPRLPNLKIRMLLLASLIFSWGGDVLLIFDDINLVPKLEERMNFFKAGLASFLIAQLIYIVLFAMHSKHNNKRSLVMRRPFILVVMAVVTGVIFLEIKDTAQDLIVPVVVYTIALLGMVISALNRRGRTNEVSFWLVAFGAFAFLLSDTLIAFDHFHTPIDGMYIMTTYMFAQGAIVLGLLNHSDRREVDATQSHDQ
jgi:uncharacterized membrane protein YhhN